MNEHRQSFKAVTWSIRYDEALPPAVVHHDHEGRKWIRASFLYEDRRRYHLRMTYDEFITGLRAQHKFRFWDHVQNDQQVHTWITTR